MLKVPKYKDIILLFSVFNTILTLGTPAPTFIIPAHIVNTPESTLAKFVTISSRIMMTSSRIMMTSSKIMMTSSKIMMTSSRIMMTFSKNVTTSTFLREYIR